MNAPTEGLTQRYFRAGIGLLCGYAVISLRKVVEVRSVPIALHNVVVNRRAEEVEAERAVKHFPAAAGYAVERGEPLVKAVGHAGCTHADKKRRFN